MPTEEPGTVEHGRPGKARRVLAHPLVRLVVGFVVLIAAAIVVQLLFKPLASRDEWRPLARAAAAIVGVVVGLATYAGMVRAIERRPVAELALRHALGELGLGVLTGGLLFTAVIGTLWAFGSYHVTAVGDWTTMIPALWMGLGSGFLEELLFRGVVFRNLEDQWGTWAALALSAALFGLIHISNPHSSLWAATAIAVEAGILLGAAYILTRRLWLPIGIHFAWNFTQGGIFGVAVSGGMASGVLTSTLSGPALISGGEFGAEASVFAVVICLAVGIVFAWRAHRAGHFKPFGGRRREMLLP